MKVNLKHYLRIFRRSLAQVVRSYPVELALAAYAAVLGIVCYELNSNTVEEAALLPKLALVPLFFAWALVVDRLAGRGPWRRIYWVAWTPLVPLSLWSGLGDWIASMPYAVSLGVLAPLALLLCRPGASNLRFVSDAIVWLRSALLAGLFANVALGLFAAILFSTTYIFGLHGAWIGHLWMYAVIFCESFVAPCLFLMMADRWRDAGISGNRILAVLLDYIVSPALLIYVAILYLYAAKILLTWTLPEGGVAYLVFGFTIVALCVKALQLVLDTRRYDWFFDRFSFVSLPLLVLFWVGVARRIGEYGLTEPRVWLVVCGGIMTLCVLLFLTPRTARYRWVCALAFGIFALVAYVPALRPERIAVRSQFRCALAVAERLDLLNDDGTLRLDRFGADTTLKADYRRFYEAAEYVWRCDTAVFDRFGVSRDELRRALPESIHDYVVYGWTSADTVEIVETVERLEFTGSVPLDRTAGYTMLYPSWKRRWNTPASDDCSFRFSNDTLTLHFGGKLPDWSLSRAELLAAQLRRAGIATAWPSGQELQDACDALSVYRDERRIIVFRNMNFDRSDSTLRISDLSVCTVLTR
ncbi:MAG: DUF4153 domain-containing protein [Alistipes sp.]|nr:DUF4153 domain-containing protein [Alistipes senegalensis]MCM1250506.1 DUF4153 domain-containing protein [Alistipes sp.]